MEVILLVAGFGAVLVGAVLFTNAVEWAGQRLGLGIGAVGTLLAGVSTALPESAIPVVAILRGDPAGDEVAVGAIVGAPFMLATIAMAVVGLSALAFAGRRDQGRSLRVHRGTLKRDLVFFLVLLGAAMAVGLGAPGAVRFVAAPLFVLSYAAYVVATVRSSGRSQADNELPPLLSDPTPHDPPGTPVIWFQFLAGLVLIVGGAHLIVEQLIAISELVGVSPLVLSLLIAPLATELPEKANSILWIREGKDTLALGNITGAMVFQSTLPVAIGVGFTDWELGRFALLAMMLALAGGAVAVWSLQLRRRFSAPAIGAWIALYATFAAGLWLLD